MDPQQAQQFEQNWLKAYQAGVQQPTAQLQETQAAAGAAGASAALQTTEEQTQQVKAQQAQALQGLRNDLQKGATLRDSLSKYTALGMSADDVFKQYLAESPYGTPQENPNELQQLGVSADALGKIGDPGSFMDKYNTKNAITELRNLEDMYGQAGSFTREFPLLGAMTPQGKAYEAAKTVLGNHLASLIPGASGAQATGQSLINQLPSMGQEFEPSAARGQFNAIEKQLLASKGYSPSDVGLAEPSNKSLGSSFITKLLQNAGKDVGGMIQGEQQREQVFGPGFGGAIASTVTSLPSLLQTYSNIAKDPGKAFTEKPVSSTMAVLGPLLGLKGGPGAIDATAADQAETAATSQAASDVFSKAPGKFQQFLDPTKSKNIIGQIRDQVVANADKTGKTVSGDNVVTAFKTWADQAKLASPADSGAIDEAVMQAEKNYTGKTFTPSQLKGVYDQIESGYTVKGIPKSATSANIDRGMQDVLQGQMEAIAPGFQKTTDLFRQTYQAEKSPMRGFAKGAAKSAVGLGLTAAGAEWLRHIFGI